MWSWLPCRVRSEWSLHERPGSSVWVRLDVTRDERRIVSVRLFRGLSC